jgi:hypothetical protein
MERRSELNQEYTVDAMRVQNCLLGAFLGDTMAMPLHWYYDRAALGRDYGRVVNLVAP